MTGFLTIVAVVLVIAFILVLVGFGDIDSFNPPPGNCQ